MMYNKLPFQTCEYKDKCKTSYRKKCRKVTKKKCRSYRTCGLKEGRKCRQEIVDECEKVRFYKKHLMLIAKEVLNILPTFHII